VANRVNAIFHITAGGTVSLVVHAAETFLWRYGILIDKGGVLGGSLFDVGWDGMGTLVDSSSGGLMPITSSLVRRPHVAPTYSAATPLPAAHLVSILDAAASFPSTTSAPMEAREAGCSAQATIR